MPPNSRTDPDSDPLGDKGTGIFHKEGGGPLELLVAPSDGGEWLTRKVILTDDMPADASRLPVKVVADGGSVVVAYITTGPGDFEGTNGQGPEGGTYHLARTDDAGVSWSPGAPIASVERVTDLNMMMGLSTSGSRIIANYDHAGDKNWTEGGIRTVWLGSDNGGSLWFELDGAPDTALFGQASFSPSGSRAVAAEVVPGPDGSEVFQVRELRPVGR